MNSVERHSEDSIPEQHSSNTVSTPPTHTSEASFSQRHTQNPEPRVRPQMMPLQPEASDSGNARRRGGLTPIVKMLNDLLVLGPPAGGKRYRRTPSNMGCLLKRSSSRGLTVKRTRNSLRRSTPGSGKPGNRWGPMRKCWLKRWRSSDGAAPECYGRRMGK